MGRLEKLKRQAILEANQRNLGIINEQSFGDAMNDVNKGFEKMDKIIGYDGDGKETPYYWTGLLVDRSTPIFSMAPSDPWEYKVVQTMNSSNLDPNDPIDDDFGLNTTLYTYYTRKKGGGRWINLEKSNADVAKAINKITAYIHKNNLKFNSDDDSHHNDDGKPTPIKSYEDFLEDNEFGI